MEYVLSMPVEKYNFFVAWLKWWESETTKGGEKVTTDISVMEEMMGIK